jgi:Mitochondrial ribosomal protein subunit L20
MTRSLLGAKMNTNALSTAGAIRALSKTQKHGRIDMLPFVTLRLQSSYRRTRSRLNIKPDPSFLPSKTEAHDHIIYNPPPSAPNVYHTPTIFLPKTDRRRQLHEEAALKYPHLASATPAELPPPLRTPYEKRYHLTAEDMEEMRRLRREDPIEWSATKLARKFDTSNLFVGLVTDGIAKRKRDQQKQVLDVVKSRWGVKRRTAREDRALRKERWGRDG